MEAATNICDGAIYADTGRRSRCRPRGVVSGVCTSSGGSSPGGYNLGCNLRGVNLQGVSPACYIFILCEQKLLSVATFIRVRGATMTAGGLASH